MTNEVDGFALEILENARSFRDELCAFRSGTSERFDRIEAEMERLEALRHGTCRAAIRGWSRPWLGADDLEEVAEVESHLAALDRDSP